MRTGTLARSVLTLVAAGLLLTAGCSQTSVGGPVSYRTDEQHQGPDTLATTTPRSDTRTGSTAAEPPSSLPTSVAAPSTPTSRGRSSLQDLEQLAGAVPDYPHSTADSQGARVATNDQGQLVLTRTWRVADPLPDVAAWFRSRYPNSEQTPKSQNHAEFNITSNIAPKVQVAVFSPTVVVVLNNTTDDTAITVITSGTPIPNRTGDLDIPLHRIESTTLTWWSTGRARAVTRTVSARDTATLVGYLNGASLLAPATYSSLSEGVASTLTFVATDGTVYRASYNSASSLSGTELDISTGPSRRLDLPAQYYALLSALMN